ncbi:Putative serine/threonine-protein kinase/receptor R818 [Rhizoctonia solani]|uniref:Putative serine/threonine-protein kinase/receptor R818 n=1 Tax=Rhizoctonia solani TaxID=456999 RepID=A0A0K6FPX4_9AGAM|nr:Putative serine/threonine-protein kinase/receptor R818 [Rhizoctonia solani]
MEPSMSENDVIGPQMSIREMFDLLLDHGCVDLASKMDSEQDTAMIVSGGGFGDIWMGKMHDGAKVAIKAWRASALEQYSYKTLKRATREIHVWSKMKHRNVHQLMGVIMFRGVYIGMVSEWMDNGNLYEYMRKHPNFDRYQMCVQIASGLAYMHQNDVVHGDLKSMNILMSLDGVPKLSDFGLSNMSGGSLAFSNTSSGQSGTIRWAAPEQLLTGAPSTKGSDVYALAMTMLEIFTGRIPYPECQRDFQIIVLLQKGTLPERPKELSADNEQSSEMWNLLLSCWNHEPGVRPSATAVLESLSEFVKSEDQSIPEPTDPGVSYTDRYRRLGGPAFEKAVEPDSRALKLTPDGHPDMSSRYASLGMSYGDRYRRLGELADLEKSIEYHSRALELTPDGHPDMSYRHASLAASYTDRYRRLGELADLEKAIEYHSRALKLTPEGHLDMPLRYASLAASYTDRYRLLGELADLEKSIEYHSRALESTPNDHRDMSDWHASLAASYTDRYRRLGELADLEKAIEYHSRALELTPDGHPDMSLRYANLGASYTDRYRRLGELVDLERAIEFQSRALALTSDGPAPAQ